MSDDVTPLLIDEVASGDEQRALEAIRDSLAEHMSRADPNVVAQIAARLQAVISRLAELEPVDAEVSVSDDIARRREARRSAATVGEDAARSSVKRRKRSS